MQYSLSKNIDTIVSAEDLANAVEDEFGVKYSKDGLRLLEANENITNYVVKEGTRVICDEAFSDCRRLTSVTIPNSVTRIGEGAFEGCSGLTSVTIPNYVTSIGDWAFDGCSEIAHPIIVKDMFVFLPTRYKGHYSIPENISKIIGGAFEDCSGLTSVTIPNSVTSIGDHAFWGCSGLTSVTIPNSVTSIGGWAFSKCSSLQSIIIPPGTKQKFAGFLMDSKDKLVEIFTNMQNSLISENLDSIVDEFGVKYSKDGLRLLKANENITNYVVKAGTRVICDYAFFRCSGLTSVTIPNSVTSVGKYAFCECSGLTSVTIPDSVISIGEDAFESCSGLTSVEIPNFLTSIGDSAFKDCSEITHPIIVNDMFVFLPKGYNGHYSIPENILKIIGGAFYTCSGLTSVTIPNSVTSIGFAAFEGCDGLQSIIIPSGTKQKFARLLPKFKDKLVEQ